MNCKSDTVSGKRRDYLVRDLPSPSKLVDKEVDEALRLEDVGGVLLAEIVGHEASVKRRAFVVL